MININPILFFFCKASNFKDDKKNHKRMKIIIKFIKKMYSKIDELDWLFDIDSVLFIF